MANILVHLSTFLCSLANDSNSGECILRRISASGSWGTDVGETDWGFQCYAQALGGNRPGPVCLIGPLGRSLTDVVDSSTPTPTICNRRRTRSKAKTEHVPNYYFIPTLRLDTKTGGPVSLSRLPT